MSIRSFSCQMFSSSVKNSNASCCKQNRELDFLSSAKCSLKMQLKQAQAFYVNCSGGKHQEAGAGRSSASVRQGKAFLRCRLCDHGSDDLLVSDIRANSFFPLVKISVVDARRFSSEQVKPVR